MRLKTACKYILRNLVAYPLRLAAVLFLSTLALAFLGLAVTASCYDERTSRMESAFRNEYGYLVLPFEGTAMLFDPAAMQDLTDYAPALRGMNVRYGRDDPLSDWGYYYRPLEIGEYESLVTPDILYRAPAYFACADAEFIEKAGISVIGRLPERDDEIALPMCSFLSFQKVGYYDRLASPQRFDPLEGAVYDPAYVRSVPDVKTFTDGTFKVGLGGTDKAAATVVGVVDYGACYQNHIDEHSFGFRDAAFVSEGYFDSLMRSRFNIEATAQYLFYAKGESVEGLYALQEFLGEGDRGRLSLVTISAAIEKEETLRTIGNVFLLIGAGLVVFCGMLIYQFVSFSLENRKGEVGVLRALGAGRGKVCLLFLAEFLSLALIEGIGGFVLSVALTPVVNLALTASISVPYVFMRFTAWSIPAVFGVSILLTALSAAIPIYKIAGMPPSEAIMTYRD